MLELFLSLAVLIGSYLETKYEVWFTPKGQAARKYSEAATKEVADKVAAALKTAGTAEVRPVTTLKSGAAPKGTTQTGTQQSDLTVARGQITFDAEGTEGRRYHSRTPSVPTDSSGLTIGRGYDMKEKSAEKIKADLIAAGLSEADAVLYAKAAGLSGAAAREFIKNNKLPEITLAQQKKLFEIAYAEKEADVKRISEKKDVVDAYGATDWAKLDPSIKTMLVDLIYRGDYTGATRKFVQPLVVANDVAGLAKVMADSTKWPGVPSERFKARKQLMEAAAAALPKKP
jgi:hypothetical protein